MCDSTANSPVISSLSIMTTRPEWMSRMPERFQLTLKRTAWAASRLMSSNPPRVQPAGNGKLPPTVRVLGRKKKTWPKRTKSWSGIQTKKERK